MSQNMKKCQGKNFLVYGPGIEQVLSAKRSRPPKKLTKSLTPHEELCLVSKLPQFIHLILKNLFFALLDI